jgi:hypothetical protein
MRTVTAVRVDVVLSANSQILRLRWDDGCKGGQTEPNLRNGGLAMQCNLAKVYVLIASAIAMLAAAIAAASIFFNVPGLIVAIALALAVSGIPGTNLGIIAQIRLGLLEYDQCRGPSERCRIGPNIDLLGQAASLLSVVAWTIALVLQISALGFITSFFLSWLGVSLAAAGEALKWSGIVGAGAAAAVLIGLLTQVRNYEACRDAEGRGEPPIT